MKVEQNFTIDGSVVKLKSEFAGLRVYENGTDSEITLYFARGADVVQTLRIASDCDQNMGYISECEFTHAGDRK